MSGKSESDEGVVAFVVNFSLRNDRLMVIASQSVDQPLTTLSMCPASMKKYLYAFYPAKKTLGVVPFCDDVRNNRKCFPKIPVHYANLSL